MGCNCSNGNEYISEIRNEMQTNNDEQIEQNEQNEKENSLIEDEGDIIINIKQEKEKLMNKVSSKGYFLNKDIKAIIENINPKVNSTKIPKELKEKVQNKNNIKLQLMKMKDGSLYEGSWNKEGQREGFGISLYNNKYIYKGLWENDVFNNYGCLFNNKENYYYIGQFIDGKAKGKGELLINNKIKYNGNFENNLPNGKGNIIYLDEQIKYNGDIINGNKDGFGILEFKDGTKYEGEFKNDKYNGKGKIIYSDNSEYEGYFKNNLKDGKGIFKWSNGNIYEGEFKNDKKHGKGKFTFKPNQFYEGYWINDLAHGKGLYNINGKIIEGIFKYGKMIIENNKN